MPPPRRFPGPPIRRTPVAIGRPVPISPAPPRFAAIGDSLWTLAMARYPGFLRSWVVELPSPSVLDQAKAKLQSLGIENFNQVGDLTLTQHLTVNRQGLDRECSLKRIGKFACVQNLDGRSANLRIKEAGKVDIW